MKLRWRVQLYGLALIGVASGLLLTYLSDRPWLFLLGEAALLALAVFGYRLVREVFGPLETLADTTRLLSEQEFTTRLRPVGHPEMDRLIGIYNRMTEILRQQRIHNQEQEFFLQKVLATTRSAIVAFDYDHRIEQANPAAEVYLEAPLESLRGKTLEELGAPLARALAAIPDAESRVLPFRGRRRLKCARAHFVDRGFFKSYLFIDELTAELRQTEKAAYEKLIRVMSHEINNSLGAANSLLHSLLNYARQIDADDRQDFRAALEVIISRADHLKTFVSDYASVVKLPPPKLEPTDLAALLERVRVLLSAELSRREICWTQEQEPVKPVALDPLQMEQALLNVAKNAMEAIDRDGAIAVLIRAGKQRPSLTIEDSGPGIPGEIEEQLFTPFYTTKPTGQGIGLTMVAEILNNHGFDFSLDSEPGQPTRFTIWF